jgi:hypothetical protein
MEVYKATLPRSTISRMAMLIFRFIRLQEAITPTTVNIACAYGAPYSAFVQNARLISLHGDYGKKERQNDSLTSESEGYMGSWQVNEPHLL